MALKGAANWLGQFKFVSVTLGSEDDTEKAPAGGGNRFADSWLAAVPVPLPENYVLGIDLQRRDFESYGQPSYLRGEFSERGWWYYYLYALAIKVPLGTWVLIALAATRRWWWQQIARSPLTPGPSPTRGEGRQEITWRDEFILLCPAVVILAFVSSQSGFSQHMRYVLPAFPFVFVWIGRLALVFDRQHRILASVAAVALAWSIASGLSVYPHSLSYFNEMAGGPMGGPRHLIHSNVDWGAGPLEV